MRIDKSIFNISAWLALFTILVFPGKIWAEGEGAPRIEYGFPFRFFIKYYPDYMDSSPWFIKGVHIQLLSYFFNVLVIYWILHMLLSLGKSIKKKE
ncbi:hypothetical protein [Paenibacillus lautus]|uniref:hypothetical protein n=1 Tax=Paenibacillus TaxID=44249 RepID=UPI001C7E0CFA|nr:hypothetical protein [Paenibacillus lautus]MBX4147904.1 hypothetical protein [Paenibacillus lautus]